MRLLIQGLWPFGRRYEARMLNRDARYIVEDALGRFSKERVVQMANATRAHLEEARRQLEQPHIGPANVLVHFRGLHRTARRERQDMGLSAITLAIIYLRAQAHGEACRPAVTTITDFISDWATADEAGASTGQAGHLEA